MCELYNLDSEMPEIRHLLKKVNGSNTLVEEGDKEPSEIVPVLSGQGEEPYCHSAIWGLAKGEMNKLVYNVYTEHVLYHQKYRRDLLEHPAVFPVSSFYEWENTSSRHREKYKCHNGKHPVYLAGFYKKCKDGDGSTSRRATVLTTKANREMMRYQYRMPVLLEEFEVKAWLAGRYIEYFLLRTPGHVEIQLVD